MTKTVLWDYPKSSASYRVRIGQHLPDPAFQRAYPGEGIRDAYAAFSKSSQLESAKPWQLSSSSDVNSSSSAINVIDAPTMSSDVQK